MATSATNPPRQSAILILRNVPHIPTVLHLSPGQIGAVAFGVAATAGVGLYAYLHRRPNPEEIERLRRLFLATQGRITDATLIDTIVSNPAPPGTLQYQYRVAGVIYESSQDISAVPGLADVVHNLRVDLPVQVRYDPHNPGNSIVVAEAWSGLRLGIVDSDLMDQYLRDKDLSDKDSPLYPPEV